MRRPSTISPPLVFLYTDIGRGHPFYLDGIIEALERRGEPGPTWARKSVFEVSRDLSRLAWRVVRSMYRRGSSGGVAGRVYGRIRANGDYTQLGISGRMLGRDLRRFVKTVEGPVVVAHPLLTALLSDKARVIYQHGESVAPSEALVPGAEMVMVPAEDLAAQFMEAGYRREQVLVSGLCIEPSIAAQARESFDLRRARLRSDGALTGLFLSSGAEPKQHIEQMISSITSCVEAGVKVVVLARAAGRLERAVVSLWRANGVLYHRLSSANLPITPPEGHMMAVYETRRVENELAARIFSRVDFLVGPPHERTNWALGLGLPMFLVSPAIGPFAPLNRHLLLKAGVAAEIKDREAARKLATAAKQLREEGKLLEMAGRGWRKDINGFERIAGYLAERYA